MVMLLLVAFMYWHTYALPQAGKWDRLGPAAWPRMVLMVLGLLSLILLVTSLAAGRAQPSRQPKERPSGEGSTQESRSNRAKARLAVTIFALMFAYILIIPKLGFVLSSIPFLVGCQWILSPRQTRLLPGMVVLAVALTLVVNYVFARYLGVYLPSGILR